MATASMSFESWLSGDAKEDAETEIRIPRCVVCPEVVEFADDDEFFGHVEDEHDMSMSEYEATHEPKKAVECRYGKVDFSLISSAMTRMIFDCKINFHSGFGCGLDIRVWHLSPRCSTCPGTIPFAGVTHDWHFTKFITPGRYFT